MFKKFAHILFFIIGSVSSLYGQLRTEILQENIKTLQVNIVDGTYYDIPVINLESNNEIEISFDELSNDIHYYYYKVQHCDANWVPSDISPLQWADGFTYDLPIEDVETSQNTTYQYTHYRFTLPNDELLFKVSGNYAVTIYEDNDETKKVAIACFSIVDNKVTIDASVRGNTDIDIKGKMQQLDFAVYPGSYNIDNPLSEIKVVVMQNGRYDNMVNNIEPTYASADNISYINNKALIFEGGDEYHILDISSIYALGEHVNKMHFITPHYHAELFGDKIKPDAPYIYQQDANGNYVVNIQEYDEDEIWADYIYTHFSIPTDFPFFDGHIYIISKLNNNIINENVRMDYNTSTRAYEKTILLKQGGYNFLYGFKEKGNKNISTQRIEGSSWKTENEYAIYVYHQGFGDRYDKLIGFKVIQSNKE